MITLVPVTIVLTPLFETTTPAPPSPPRGGTLKLDRFLKGEKGDSGDSASVSADAENIATLGTDGGIFVEAPSLTTEHW